MGLSLTESQTVSNRFYVGDDGSTAGPTTFPRILMGRNHQGLAEPCLLYVHCISPFTFQSMSRERPSRLHRSAVQGIEEISSAYMHVTVD